MSLLERYRAMKCARQGCERERMRDAALCADDLSADWRHELDRQPDGSFVPRRTFPVRDFTRSAA